MYCVWCGSSLSCSNIITQKQKGQNWTTISTPQQNHASYVNRKSYHKIVMQVLVDSNYLFRDIVVGWPRSVHDARVISNSRLYALGCSGRLFPPDVKEEILGRKFILLSWQIQSTQRMLIPPGFRGDLIIISVEPGWPLRIPSDVGKEGFQDSLRAWIWRLMEQSR